MTPTTPTNTAANKVDFGRTAEDYRQHRAGFPDELFARLAIYGIGIAGQRLLDLGTGTGTLARGFARQGCKVTALDPSADLIEEARKLDDDAGVHIDYITAPAEQTGLPDAAFDVVSAGQCWHWFDRPRAAAECSRLLRPGGVMLIAHFDWLPLPGSVVEASERLIRRYNPAWQGHDGSGIHWKWFADLSEAGFLALESFSFDKTVGYSHEAWRGRIRASAGIAASLSEERVAAFDDEHAALLEARFPAEPLRTPHRVFALIGRKAFAA
jgi:SAM-dependent methyltransferase